MEKSYHIRFTWDVEKELKEWIDQKRKAGIGISTTVIHLKAKSMAKARNVAESEFKASVHWCHHLGLQILRWTQKEQNQCQS